MTHTRKLYWEDVANRVKKIDPALASLINDLSPGRQHTIYLCSYDYGDVIGDHLGVFLKGGHGNKYRLGSSCTPSEIKSDLGYGINSTPLMMMLSKNFEWYVSDKLNNTSFPIYIEGPGFFVGTRALLSDTAPKPYLSSSMMSCTAGTNSAFMLPNIGNQRNHSFIQRQVGISCCPPKEMQNHISAFKEIASTQGGWKAEVLFFSAQWIQSLKNNPKWIYLQQHLLTKMIKGWEYDKNHFFYSYAFSRAKLQSNTLNNSFLNETAKHILGIAIGANIGFKPATNNMSLPLDAIQKTYMEVYRLKQSPIILEPAKLQINASDPSPIYYSLQRSIIRSLERPTKTEPRAIVNLLTLKDIISKYVDNFNSSEASDYYAGTILSNIQKEIEFTYFHHSPGESHHIIKSNQLPHRDKRFNYEENTDLAFPSDSRFLRGCICIRKK